MQASRSQFDWQWQTKRVDRTEILREVEDEGAEQEGQCGRYDRRGTRPGPSYSLERTEAGRKHPGRRRRRERAALAASSTERALPQLRLYLSGGAVCLFVFCVCLCVFVCVLAGPSARRS